MAEQVLVDEGLRSPMFPGLLLSSSVPAGLPRHPLIESPGEFYYIWDSDPLRVKGVKQLAVGREGAVTVRT